MAVIQLVGPSSNAPRIEVRSSRHNVWRRLLWIAAIVGGSALGAHVSYAAPPANDNCSGAVQLALDRVVKGTTVEASDDYQSPSSAACFAGVGQAPTTSPGIDVVFFFTAPANGAYSVRYVQDDSAAALRTQNPVLYAASDCPAGGAVNCLKGANRMAVNGAANANRSEEIDCLPMAAGQTIYVFFDDGSAGNSGGPLALEVTECVSEAEPNDAPGQANSPACVTTATISPGDSYVCAAGTPHAGTACVPSVESTSHLCGPTSTAAQCVFSSVGDVDFYSLGIVPIGAKIFAAIDAVAASNSDFEMRITTATDTLGYDNDDGTSLIGATAPVIGGVPGTGVETFVRVSYRGATGSEPYHLYTRVEGGTAQDDIEPSNDFYYGNVITAGGYVRGTHYSNSDLDCFKFIANEGDNIAMFSDNNPSRVAGGIVNTWPLLYDLIGGPPTATRFSGQVLRNILTPSPGTLTGTTPSVVSEFWNYRARYTGLYMVCYYPDNASGGYPRPYAGSISLSCGSIPDPASRIADVSISLTGPTGPVNTGSVVEYTITVTNNGTDFAQDVLIGGSLPQELVFVDLTIVDGFGGQNVGCMSMPTQWTNDAPIECTNYAMAPGTTTTYTVHALVQNWLGAGVTITTAVEIGRTASTDPELGNNSSYWSFSGPVINTPVGTGIVLSPVDPANSGTPTTVTFDEVTGEGVTAVWTNASGPALPPGFANGNPRTYFTLATDASYVGSIQLCVNYGGQNYRREDTLRLLLNTQAGTWNDITLTRDASSHTICGATSALGTVVVAEPVSLDLTKAGMYTFPSIPGRATFADMNRDGHLDMVVSGNSAGNLAIFLGVGNGTFGAPRVFGVTTFSVPVKAGDFNGDGLLDVAYGGYDALFILLGDGDGGLGQPRSFPCGGLPFDIALSDFNHDGNLDVAAANQLNGTASILLGDGAGNLSSPLTIGIGQTPTSIWAVDVNTDGNDDIVVGDEAGNTVVVLSGDGLGGFAVTSTLAVCGFPTGFGVGDFDGDGVGDLVVACNSDYKISFLRGNGLGGFDVPIDSPAGSSVFAPRAADFDGDGKLDIVAVGNNEFLIFLGTGSGHFLSLLRFGTGDNPVSVTAADVNEDGRTDITVLEYYDQATSVFLNTPPNTGVGSGVAVALQGTGMPTTLVFSQVTAAGTTSVMTTTMGPALPQGFILGSPATYVEILTGAVFSGPVDVCIDYSGSSYGDVSSLRLLHATPAGAWEDITTSLNTAQHTICGRTTSFSPFVVAQRVNHPPIADAGLNQSVEATSPLGALVMLDASESTDVDGDTLNYSWTGPFGALQGQLVAVQVPIGVWTIGLTVSDPYGASASDTTVVAVTPRSCDDGNPCTDDTGIYPSCIHSDNSTSCDDGNACTQADLCQNGACVAGPGLDCNDNSVCTNDSCDPGTGCVHAQIDCADGDGCTLDTCGDPAGCQHTVTCVENPPAETVPPGGTASTDPEGDGATPSDQIETAVMTPTGGQVRVQEGPATEPLPVGYDVLDLQSVITAPPATAADPLVLVFQVDASALPTGYVLSSLAVFRNSVLVANCTGAPTEANPDPCVSARVVLGDGDAQLTVLTSAASTWNLAFPNCDDANPCTDDSGAYPACVHANNTAACNDGNACSQTDACEGGACVGSNPVTCIAGDQCHDAGVCDPGTGVCSNPIKANGSSCSDGNACTQTDSCQAGTCTGTSYSWSGVLQPINADGTSVFKLGSTIPTKFKLTGACAGNSGLVANIYFYKVTNSEGPVNEATSPSAADTGTVFRYSSGDQYIYNLGTKGLSEGTWHLGIDLHDGVGMRVVTVGLRK